MTLGIKFQHINFGGRYRHLLYSNQRWMARATVWRWGTWHTCHYSSSTTTTTGRTSTEDQIHLLLPCLEGAYHDTLRIEGARDSQSTLFWCESQWYRKVLSWSKAGHRKEIWKAEYLSEPCKETLTDFSIWRGCSKDWNSQIGPEYTEFRPPSDSCHPSNVGVDWWGQALWEVVRRPDQFERK